MGARMWVVQTPLFDGNHRTIDFCDRLETERLIQFKRRWRRAHARWWQFWKWDPWARPVG